MGIPTLRPWSVVTDLHRRRTRIVGVPPVIVYGGFTAADKPLWATVQDGYEREVALNFWESWARRSLLALGLSVIGSLSVPIVGVLILRFLLSGPGNDIPTGPPLVPAPVITSRLPFIETGSLPTVLPTAPSPSPESAATTSPSPKTVTQGEVNATDGLNVRTEPSSQALVQKILPFGERVKLSGKTRLSEGLTWVELADGGWVQEQYLDPR